MYSSLSEKIVRTFVDPKGNGLTVAMWMTKIGWTWWHESITNRNICDIENLSWSNWHIHSIFHGVDWYYRCFMACLGDWTCDLNKSVISRCLSWQVPPSRKNWEKQMNNFHTPLRIIFLKCYTGHSNFSLYATSYNGNWKNSGIICSHHSPSPLTSRKTPQSPWSLGLPTPSWQSAACTSWWR